VVAVAPPAGGITTTRESFGGLDLPTAVVDLLVRRGITTPTPIQARSIPDALAGRDILGRAETGSGKTLAFGLPMLCRLAAERRSGRRGPRAVVLLPTRELAHQVQRALAPLASVVGLRMLLVVGGTSITQQMRELNRGVDVVVATPGRLIDLLERRAVDLGSVSVAVLDEADHMADLGFLPPVTRILDAMPSDRQCLLFSATLDRDVDKLVRRYLHEPAVHRVGQPDATSGAAMQHRVFRLNRADKLPVAIEIAARQGRTLFFVRTKHGADRLARQFRSHGIEAVALHGNLNQNQRRRALDAFSSGRTPVLVATDVAARGIHVDNLDLVVHFDPPADHKTYAHRSGRTARAGATGTVLSLVEPDQHAPLARLHAAAKVSASSVTVRAGHPVVTELAARTA
jgi:superfamily II DNA/RNA helicase